MVEPGFRNCDEGKSVYRSIQFPSSSISTAASYWHPASANKTRLSLVDRKRQRARHAVGRQIHILPNGTGSRKWAGACSVYENDVAVGARTLATGAFCVGPPAVPLLWVLRQRVASSGYLLDVDLRVGGGVCSVARTEEGAMRERAGTPGLFQRVPFDAPIYGFARP